MSYHVYRRVPGSDVWSEICECGTPMSTAAVLQAILEHHHGDYLYLRVDMTRKELNAGDSTTARV